ncbi:ABC transporter substrate-binding protein [Ensifer sp. T173]|jgi:branched-chain amino acid transport system substrate-binding protein|uniref:ABC transporter substrate-binding protein n=1 Tax=Ensifer canadensis TaxID=555315 RepID=A0AAW4FH18_9HYPH|nr:MULTISPECIES: branched-chain amino acid ABC transporter substrate-binding protein [Ensifer]MDP9632183.1 branched-chain amino acid transport system substrate-binding protein [Ensifer adhaerens]KQU97881.1 ABC transporter [Ensifer sp. Root31]MBM3091409.1 ABC transporter substrate-binding protein [Ensifer canadensis]PSS64012.1 branched-chain amino acid ABC transporter substrate-binding protein [Ensifer sp. NM-2]UBI78918.1 branched-chain amino acid ABC transporter substrate-binding protein [Ensi
MHRVVTIAVAALAAIYICPAQAEVVIGVSAAMTGRLAWIGEQGQRGAEMAVADINAAGGVLGQQVRVINVDDFCDPEQAVAAAKKLVADGVVFVVGHYCSGASIPASKVYEEAAVLQISPGSTNPLLTEQGRDNVFRVIGRDDKQGIVAGNYLADEWGEKKIAILHDGTTYGMGLAGETRKQLNKRGVTEAVYDAYTPAKNDYSAEIAALQAAGIAVLYVGGYHAEVALIVRAARDRAYALQVISGDALATEEFALIAGPGAEGTLFTFSADPRRNPEAAPVVERFRAENFEPAGYTLLSYAAVQLWAQAVDKAASLELPAVIATLRGQEFDTVLGPVDFDDKGDLTNQSWVWYVWRGGEYVPVE